jgi:hypothetical protein
MMDLNRRFAQSFLRKLLRFKARPANEIRDHGNMQRDPPERFGCIDKLPDTAQSSTAAIPNL